MAFLPSLDISASALTAERLRMDLIANNLANALSTRSPGGGPYRRQMPIFAARQGPLLAGPAGVQALPAPPLAGGPSGLPPAVPRPVGGGGVAPSGWGGVEVVAIVEDPAPPKLVYDPDHPDARPDGYVEYPNVDVVTEMVDMLAASRSYQANLAAFSVAREMARSALDLIRA